MNTKNVTIRIGDLVVPTARYRHNLKYYNWKDYYDLYLGEVISMSGYHTINISIVGSYKVMNFGPALIEGFYSANILPEDLYFLKLKSC